MVDIRYPVHRALGLVCLSSSLLLVIPNLVAQGVPTSSDPGRTVFHTDVQSVVVDVVVTDSHGKPRKGLRKEDFEVLEQGKPQKIASFEEHSGDSTTAGPVARPQPLGANLFSNAPAEPASDTVNVLLLDTLNSSVTDQSYVHAQATKYLKNLAPGTPMAIFTLSTQLRFVLGFTADASKLSAALNQTHGNAVPDPSPLLQSSGEANANQEMISQSASMAREHAPPGQAADPVMRRSVEALSQFQGENEGSKNMARVKMTMEALEDLARYLAAVPGRKNVIWFAGDFPVTIGGNNYEFDYSEQLKKTTNELAAARVSIYLVRASGVPTDSMYDSEVRMVGVTDPQSARAFQRDSLQRDSIQRATLMAVSGEIADRTGGEAFLGTNNLADSIRQVVERGSHYYTITYSPTDRRTDGRYRPIKVKMVEGNYHLEYRRGYFADTPKSVRKAAEERARDPLPRLMDPVLPDFTQIIFKARVMPLDTVPPASKGTSSAPGLGSRPPLDSKRYGLDLAVSIHDVHLQLTPEGKHLGSLELMLVAFDRKGKALNWSVRQNEVALTPESYQTLRDAGLQLHGEIDVPRGTTTLRIGILDPASGKVGTMAIPLAQVAAVSVAANQGSAATSN